MGKNGWVLIFLLAASVHAQVQMLTMDKQGNVLNPTGANFPSAIPLKINGTAFQSAPGVSKYYGTDGTGTLGYFGLPNSAVWGSITGTLSNQTDLQNALNAKQNALTFSDSLLNSAGTVTLVNDTATPGNSKYYGTNGTGTLGYFTLPVSGVSSWNGRTGAVVPLANDYLFTQLDFTASNLTSLVTRSYNDLQDLPSLNFGNHVLSGGGVAWTGTGFNFIVSPCTYVINGTVLNSPQTPLTLAPAHASLDRIDVFAVNDDSTASVITGIPGGPPLEPSIDPATQLKLTSVLVPASSSQPPFTDEDIYLENTEWTSSTNSAGTINLASTNNPYAGTKDIEGTLTVTGNNFTLVRPSSTINLANFTSFIFQIRSKATWPNNKGISIFWLNGTSTVGTAVSLKQGSFGFNSSNTSSYQQIVIPASQFNTGSALVNTVRFQVAGGGASIGWYIDNIIAQAGGGGGGGGGGDFSTNTSTSVAGEIVLFADTTGKLGKRSTGTGTAVITNGVLSVLATPTPSATFTPTPTSTATATFTPTPTATSTATATPTATSTPTPTPTPTPIGTGIALEDSNGVFQSLITTSAGVASAITDETGTAGSLVFSTSPALSGTPSSTNLAITGTAGAGYLTMVAQSANPSAPAAGTLLLHSSTVQGFTRMEQDNEAATNLVYGRDNVFIAKNVNAGTITKGQVVYNTTTSTGAVPNVDLAKADSATTLPALGVALDSIAANAFGQIMVAGVVDSFNTNSFATGDELYVSPTTAGAIQSGAPTGIGQFQQRIGSVLNKGIGNGSMLIDVAPFVAPVQVMMKSVTFVVDGGGIVLGTGTKNPVKIPFGGTLLGWTTMCKPSCSITMDVFRAADGAGLPVTSIVGLTGTKPFITTAVENKGTDFTNWTSTVLTANDNLAISLSGITAATYVELTLFYK